MPSPVGHTLGAVAAGWAIARQRPTWRNTAPLVVAGLAPDLDLLVGLHSMYTHSVGAVAVAFAAVWLFTRNPRLAAAIAAAWASHVLLDWLGSDTSPPIGIMALWPLTTAHYQSDLYVFDAISRRYWFPRQFFWGNLRAAVRETVILLPFAIAAWISTRARTRNPYP